MDTYQVACTDNPTLYSQTVTCDCADIVCDWSSNPTPTDDICIPGISTMFPGESVIQ